MKKATLALAILSALAAGAHAQNVDYNPSWYIAPSISALDPDARFGVDENGVGAGLRFGKPLSPSWDLQMGTTYARSRSDTARYQQNTLGADALYMFSRKTVRPFLLIGTGLERDKVNSSLGERSHSSPYLSAGVGVQVALNDRWSLQADYRRVHGYLRGDTFGVDRSNNNYLTVGFNYAFDKPAAAPVAQVEPAPEPVPEVVAAAPAPAPAPHVEKYTLSATELFAFNSADLRMPQPKLDEIASALGSNSDINNVVVTGYTDRIGSDKYNQKLSQRRADAVKNYLQSKGIDANRLKAEGKGEANPVVVCTDKKRPALIKCLEPNRRVEVEQITIERRVQ